jgi:amidohydrolase
MTPGGELANLAAGLRAGLAGELAGAVLLRHELHAGAELSGSEHRTAARVAAALGAADAAVVAGTGRIVRIGPRDGPSIAIRAELDALPIPEQTGAPWASRTGAMHACGHDVHLAALVALGRAAAAVRPSGGPSAGLPAGLAAAMPDGLAAAMPDGLAAAMPDGLPAAMPDGLAAAMPDGLPAALLAVLQPREEATPSGARDIVAGGELAAQRPRAVLAVHLQHQLPAGTVAAPAGTVNAACDDFEIRVDGTGGHAGYPHLVADPVLALCQVVVAVQQIVSRRTDPTHAAVVSVGALEAGRAPNVIPPAAVARGTLRALDQADRAAMHAALREIVAHTCRAHGCRGTVTIDEGEPALVNDEALAAASRPWLRAAGFAVEESFRSCGADDFARYADVAPTLMLFLGTGGPLPLHHPEFLPSDDTVGQVAAAMLAGYLGAVSLL